MPWGHGTLMGLCRLRLDDHDQNSEVRVVRAYLRARGE